MLVLNNASVPHMNALSAAELDQIVAMSNHFTVAEDSQGILGALLCLPQGTAYWSAHYQWFGERYDTFTYVDRVMVAERAKRRGVGRAEPDAREEVGVERIGQQLDTARMPRGVQRDAHPEQRRTTADDRLPAVGIRDRQHATPVQMEFEHVRPVEPEEPRLRILARGWQFGAAQRLSERLPRVRARCARRTGRWWDVRHQRCPDIIHGSRS